MYKQNPYYKEVTLKHNYFKTQKHFINYVSKVVRDRKIEHPFLTRSNIVNLSWCLANENIFNRNRIDIPIDPFTYELTKGENIDFPICDILLKVADEINKLKSRKINISDCVSLQTECPLIDQDKLFDLLEDTTIYSDGFKDLLNLFYRKPSVYFLYDATKELIYVGKSYNAHTRIQSSFRERNASYCKLIIGLNESDCNILEPYYISLLNPPLNSDLTTLDMPSFTIDHKFEFTEIIKIFK